MVMPGAVLPQDRVPQCHQAPQEPGVLSTGSWANGSTSVDWMHLSWFVLGLMAFVKSPYYSQYEVMQE